MASCGTLNSDHVLVLPACNSASACSTKYKAQEAAYTWKYVRARSRSMALLHFGIFHSNSTSGSDMVFGKYILTLRPVDFT